MGIVVKKPGVLTTIQDAGRIGYMGSGFAPSGVMDRRAFIIANLLVENDPNTCAIEFALAGPTLRFTTSTFIAITGGDFSPTLDGKPVPMYSALMVKRGSILRFGAPRTGAYGYVAVAGGSVRVPEVMGSRSTSLKLGIGGWHGRSLQLGDYLPFMTKNLDFLPNLGSHRIEYDTTYGFGSEETVVRVVPGPQEDMFTERGIETFYNQVYEATAKCDRMGYRLDGPEIETKCSPIAKLREAMPKSAPSPRSTSPNSCSVAQEAEYALRPSRCRRRKPCTARSTSISRDSRKS